MLEKRPQSKCSTHASICKNLKIYPNRPHRSGQLRNLFSAFSVNLKQIRSYMQQIHTFDGDWSLRTLSILLKTLDWEHFKIQNIRDFQAWKMKRSFQNKIIFKKQFSSKFCVVVSRLPFDKICNIRLCFVLMGVLQHQKPPKQVNVIVKGLMYVDLFCPTNQYGASKRTLQTL